MAETINNLKLRHRTSNYLYHDIIPTQNHLHSAHQTISSQPSHTPPTHHFSLSHQQPTKDPLILFLNNVPPSQTVDVSPLITLKSPNIPDNINLTLNGLPRNPLF